MRLLLTALALFAAALIAPAAAKGDEPQKATPADMQIFEPYIGVFRSPDNTFDDGETKYYFTIEYRWFDRDKSIVKYTVSMVIPSQDRTIVNSEGFYGFDPFNDRLYVFGAFTRGTTGWGAVGSFDIKTGARQTWAKSMDAEGVVTHVRDEFELTEEGWKNATRIRTGDETEWKLVYEEEYARVE